MRASSILDSQKSPAAEQGNRRHRGKKCRLPPSVGAIGEIFAFMAMFDNDIFKKRITFVEYIIFINMYDPGSFGTRGLINDIFF